MALDIPPPNDPGDALAQPTRARLFALLTELRRSAGTAELSDRLSLHPNGVRLHLERLQDAGLVTRTRARRARGRPRDAWMVAPGARPGGAAPRAYADLARWLARVLPSSAGVPPDVEAVGRRIGRELAPEGAAPGDPDALATALSALGFDPDPEPAAAGRRGYCLGNCPYRDAALERPDVVCTLHRGMTRGLVEALDPQTEMTGFHAADPDAGGCRIEVAGG